MISWLRRFDDTSSRKDIKRPRLREIEEMLDRLPRCKRKRACVSSSKRDSAIRGTIVRIDTTKNPGDGAPAERQERVKAEKAEKAGRVSVRPPETNLTFANSISKDDAPAAKTVPFDIQNLASIFKKAHANEVTVAHLHT